MTPSLLLRELLRPATDAGLLLALAAFSLLLLLADAAGLIGLWLAVIVVPALYKYLLLVLYARAIGQSTPIPGIELFNFAESAWSLTPLLLQAGAVAAAWWLDAQGSELAARAIAFGVLAVLPASLAILAVTHSPLASLNPAAWWRMLRACGGAYALIPLAHGAAGWVLLGPGAQLLDALLPATLARVLLTNYWLFLLFTLTGAVLHARGVALDLDIEAPTEGRTDPQASLARARQNVLTHAYGFLSRGNASGGLKHIEQAIAEDPECSAAWRWYFERMLQWPSHDPALALARSWLSWLLSEGREIDVLKLLTHCLAENPAFRPWPADLAATLALARRFGRDDLLRPLEDPPGKA